MALQAAPALQSMASTSSQVFFSPEVNLSLLGKRIARSSSSTRFVALVGVPNLSSSFLSRGAIKIAYPNRTTRWTGHGVGGALGSRMNFFERFARIIRSYANSILGSFEDPQKILEQAMLDMSDDLLKMRQATAEVMASQKQLKNKYKAADKAAADWYQKAKLAMENGKELMAREALKRHKSYEEIAVSLKTQLDQQKAIADNLLFNTRLLDSKIQEARSKKQTLQVRAQSAKVVTKVSGLLGNVHTSSALAAFDKIEEKVLTMESQVEALNQLTSDDLTRQFALLESASVDDDLANLKKDVSRNMKKRELPPARTAMRRLRAIPVPEPEN